MNKIIINSIGLLFICFTGFAQSKDEVKYQERAKEIQQEIWSSGNKAFDVKEIPAKYKNESAVVIAKSTEISNDTRSKYNLMVGKVRTFKYFTTYREKVWINDKTALEDFSTVNYKKTIDNTTRMMTYKFKKIFKTYIGAKVYKQSGKVIEINPSEEEVLTENKDKYKEGKIAIPDLQVGDILDYYIRVEEVMEGENPVMGPYIHFLVGEYPILYYNVKYILDKKAGADIMNMNGAKPMKESTNDDKDMILEFTETDLPKINNTLWTSAARQMPYHIVRYGFSGSGVLAKPGELKRGPFDNYLEALKTGIMYLSANIEKESRKDMNDYYDGKKNMKDLPADSMVNYLYNWYRWQQYGGFYNMEVSTDRNYKNMHWINVAVTLNEILNKLDIDHNLALVRSRYSGRLDEVFSPADYELLVKINGTAKPTWLSFNSCLHTMHELPAEYQGEEAILFPNANSGRKAKEWREKLPISKSTDNQSSEKLQVSFNKDNMQMLTIERTVTETGSMKVNSQKSLILAEDAEKGLSALINKVPNAEKLADQKRTREKAGEVQAALDKERVKQKDYFKDEIENQYDQEPKELLSYQINNMGISVQKPAFEFTQKFTMDNFVKKAGNNFIFDIGKMMGSYKKPEAKDSTRKLDVYMVSAREISHSVNVTVPDGFTAKGIEQLNKKVENDIASFISTAKLEGNVVTVNIRRVYKNAFEPASNWPKILEVMNATADFSAMKLLLEKKKA